MTNITSSRVNESGGHCQHGMLDMTNKKWIAAAGALALYLVWTVLPLSTTAAQDPQVPIPALVAGPVGIKGTTRSTSGEVMTAGQRAVLIATNIGDSAINLRMDIRDATNFSRVLATTQQTLQPGAGFTLPYIEQDNLFKGVIGVVSPSSGRFREDWSGNNSGWNGGFRGVIASLSVVDDTTNTTNFVVETNVLAIRSSLINETNGRR